MSRKMLAPMIASPLTTPRYLPTRAPPSFGTTVARKKSSSFFENQPIFDSWRSRGRPEWPARPATLPPSDGRADALRAAQTFRVRPSVRVMLRDGRRIVEHVIIHYAGGRITRQVDVEAWD